MLSRADFPGYARQYDLVPGIWVDIYFEGTDSVPFIVTGVITNFRRR